MKCRPVKEVVRSQPSDVAVGDMRGYGGGLRGAEKVIGSGRSQQSVTEYLSDTRF